MPSTTRRALAPSVDALVDGASSREPLASTDAKSGAVLERIVITELRDSTYFAELHLSAAGQARVVSSRPSDAVALAVRVGCRIFVAEEVLEEAASLPRDAVPDEVVEQFREFIDNVNPEDFAP